MSSYDEQYEGMNPHPSQEELKEMMAQKAHELFKVCDVEEKGFITKREMQRLQSQLPLTPDQLESVFDSLDDDGNGYLTLEEFTEGFGSFIGLKTGASTEVQEMDSEAVYGDEQIDHIEEEQQFIHMMNNVEAHNLFDDENTIKALWSRLRREDPEMSAHFEDFLYKVSNDIKKSKENFNTLESALKSKSSAHDQEVKKLYEEMEFQIKQEKEKAVAEEQLKEKQMRETLERELREKDLALQDMLHKHQEMEKKLNILNFTEAETKQENERLAREKEKLEEELMKSQQNLEESKYYINQLKDQQKDEKRERARAALKLSEGIAMERESLVKQLDMLRDVNRRLRDDKDEAEIRREPSLTNISLEANEEILEGEQRKIGSNQSPRKEQFERKGSVLSNYFPSSRVKKRPTEGSISEDVGNTNLDRMDDGIECDDDMIETSDSFEFNHNHNNQIAHHEKNYHLRHSGQTSDQTAKRKYDDGSHSENEYEHHEGSSRHSISSYIPDSPRSQPVGAVDETDSQETQEGTPASVQRLFKVVYVGDAGVGKSSFIHRFCSGSFRSSYAATIGVDFQIKSQVIDGHVIVLQLWDTAGQERFRSITKQYFRKADGVVVMYDVNTEVTFTNIRSWMDSIKDGFEEKAVIVLLGNKTDLAEDDKSRVIKTKDGSRLAAEYGALFYETSAKSGHNVAESMRGLASLLREKEDREIEKSFRLDENEAKKKGCCR